MMTDEMKSGTPLLAGWAIAGAAGLVAGGVSLAAIGLGLTQAAFIGIVICGAVGLILGFSRGETAGSVATAPEAAKSNPVVVEPSVVPVAPPAPAAPVAPVAVVAEPVATPSPVPVAARRPAALTAARDGGPDDLKRIKGVGPKLETLLHSLGFFHFDQIAAWQADELAWVDDNLEGFKGRATRDEWVAQAKVLAAGGAD